MSNPVVFDYSLWAARYPELAASVSQSLAVMYFSEAQLYCDNTGCSLIDDTNGARTIILNMLTAHIAALNGPSSTPLVGRISSATEGSVSVQTDFQVPGSAAWYAQTKYGAAAWQAMLPYRTARYIPGPRPRLNGLGHRW